MMEITSEMLVEACDKARGIVRRALGKRGSETEDVLQDACVKALRYAGDFQGRSQFSTWFCVIARNEALMLLRKKPWVGLEAVSPVRWVDCGPNPEQQALISARNQEIAECIELLSPKLRSAILDWMHKDDRLGTDNNAVKARVFRAKRELRVTLGIR